MRDFPLTREEETCPRRLSGVQALLRDRTALALAAAAAAILAALLVVTLAITSRPPTVVPSASPQPTASPVAIVVTPSPTPTPVPTPIPTPIPTPASAATPATPPPRAPSERPTTRTAGERMRPFYAEIRQLFPILPAGIVIDFDEPSGTEPNAVFRGLTPAGEPIFAVREDFVLDQGTAAHEIGHAYAKVLERQGRGQTDLLTQYWQVRGFPGTWQQAQTEAQYETNFLWMWSKTPSESWAEAFRAAVTLEAKERTKDYGKTIDPVAVRAFFISLMTPPRR